MDLIDITFKCPPDRVADAYINHASWLARIATQTDAEDEAAPRHDRWWNDLSLLARDVFTLLATNPDHKFPADQIATDLEVPHGRSGVAGVFAWPGRHAKKHGLPYPWCWETTDYGDTYYWMDATTATVFAANAQEHTKTARWQKKMVK